MIGRRNTVGELFVCKIVVCPHNDFSSAVDDTKQKGVELILGAEAEELLCRFERAEGIAPRTDKPKEIWELENWGGEEWAEQAMAELVFAQEMNFQYVLDDTNLKGIVAGYRVRCARNELVLIPSDKDEDVFVAVEMERAKKRGRVLGWLRGSEGKLPQFYQKNFWVIPLEALHDMETLPGQELPLVMPDQDLNHQANDGD